MIAIASDFDLGRDSTRIKDPADAERQTATAAAILERLFAPDPQRRFELQVLADEVGMGKTFVALAVAYSILAYMRRHAVPDDLLHCSRRVVIVTPQNQALFRKWQREVSEFVGRCVRPEHQEEANGWFAATAVERLDELVAALLRRSGPRIVVTHTGALGSAKLRSYDLKRRFLLGVLFRHWGKRFAVEHRERLLKGAPDGWPRDPYALTDLDAAEQEEVLFSEEDLLTGIRRLERLDLLERGASVEALLQRCREIAAPYVRGRADLFERVERDLMAIYRAAISQLGRRGIPLVIVDEAHNWKNGPSAGTNGYYGFVNALARRARRLLLLTATPFQLRPEEMLELLKIGEDTKPCPNEAAAELRRARLRDFREKEVQPVLERAASSSRALAQAWARLPKRFGSDDLASVWSEPRLASARTRLIGLADDHGAIDRGASARVIEAAIEHVDPDLRALFREALRLFVYNADLSAELGRLVVRHRRATDHRLVRVGAEFTKPAAHVLSRPDRQLLHAAEGLDVRGEGELPHYLLMRCVSEMTRGKGKTSLGGNLTGCYSTLLEAAEGRAVMKSLGATDIGRRYLGLLLDLVDASRDPSHPKVEPVVEAILRAWRAGEKSLVFCFRTHTAERLRAIVNDRIRAELRERRKKCLGGEEQMKTLRTRLTGKDRDLIVLGLDRVLWSFLWAGKRQPDGSWAACPYGPDHLALLDEELPEIARLLLRYRVDTSGDHLDRVFLHRAHEHVVAKRLSRASSPTRAWRDLLESIADASWIEGPYGLVPRQDDEDAGEEVASFDERGAQAVYDPGEEPSPSAVRSLTGELAERRARARERSVLDAYANAPSLWLGSDPTATATAADSAPGASAVADIHEHLAMLTEAGGHFDWDGRRALFQALRRSLLRESVLLRLLPERSEREDSQWGELLAEMFHRPLPGQTESMGDRIAIFLEDVRAASGSVTESGTARNTLLEATRLTDQQFVALVKGGSDADTRERVFAGFNSPLLPEVLICTSVGQEGIDLHRHCRQVIHFDLAWNPAVLEQRTGRVDRIGCKTFRERAASATPDQVFLEIGVPFLAGTYDERMYEELRLRSQTFEVLTGGAVSADNVEGSDEVARAEGTELGLRFTPLPPAMVDDLRVKLHVWKPGPSMQRRSSPE